MYASAVIVSFLALSATAAPILNVSPSTEAGALEARGIVSGAAKVIDAGLVKVFGLTNSRLGRILTKVGNGRAQKATATELSAAYRYAMKSGKDMATWTWAKAATLEAAAARDMSDHDVAILKMLARNGDIDAIAAIKGMPAATRKAYGIPQHIGKPVSKVAKVATAAAVVGGAGLAAVGAGTIIGAIVHSAKHDDSVDRASLPATVPNGAISEDDQEKILLHIAENPEDYPQVMQEVRKVPGVTPAEIALFESVDPAKVAPTVAVAAAADGPVTKRSLVDLD